MNRPTQGRKLEAFRGKHLMEHHTIAALLQLAIGFAALMAGLSILPRRPR